MFTTTSAQHQNRSVEEEVLFEFYNETGGSNWTNQCAEGKVGSCWLAPQTNHCYWLGVQCNTQGLVTTLSLPNNNLSGDPPPVLGKLTSLETLNLGYNNFNQFSPIPKEWTTLPNLISLDISNCSITTTPQMKHLTNLRNLSVQGFLDDMSFLSSLKNLEIFDMSYNVIFPELPTQLTPVHSLRYLIARYCAICDIPSLANHTCMVHLDLNHQIPTDCGDRVFSLEILSSMPNLEYLDLDMHPNTNFSDPDVLSYIFHLSRIRTLNLHNVHLDIPFPPTFFSSLPHLEVLDMSGTSIESEIPRNIGIAANLTRLILRDNFISGSIPDSILNLHRLTVLDFHNNSISGPIPTQLGHNVSSLQILDLGLNQISGPLPDSIGQMRNLTYLSLKSNLLIGSIPARAWRDLLNLRVFDLSRNNLTGYIYPDIQKAFEGLQKLDLSFNGFIGDMPGLDRGYSMQYLVCCE